MRQAYFTHGLTLDMSLADAVSASHTGDCMADVRALMDKPAIRAQLNAMSADDVRRELAEVGAWDDNELSNHADNLRRLTWIAANDVTEEAHTRHPRMMRAAR